MLAAEPRHPLAAGYTAWPCMASGLLDAERSFPPWVVAMVTTGRLERSACAMGQGLFCIPLCRPRALTHLAAEVASLPSAGRS